MGVSEGGQERGRGPEDAGAVSWGTVMIMDGAGAAYRGVSSWSV